MIPNKTTNLTDSKDRSNRLKKQTKVKQKKFINKKKKKEKKNGNEPRFDIRAINSRSDRIEKHERTSMESEKKSREIEIERG